MFAPCHWPSPDPQPALGSVTSMLTLTVNSPDWLPASSTASKRNVFRPSTKSAESTTAVSCDGPGFAAPGMATTGAPGAGGVVGDCPLTVYRICVTPELCWASLAVIVTVGTD